MKTKGPLLKISEASALLALHPNSVRRLCKSGRLPYLIVGGQYRFEESALLADARYAAAAHEIGEAL